MCKATENHHRTKSVTETNFYVVNKEKYHTKVYRYPPT